MSQTNSVGTVVILLISLLWLPMDLGIGRCGQAVA